MLNLLLQIQVFTLASLKRWHWTPRCGRGCCGVSYTNIALIVLPFIKYT